MEEVQLLDETLQSKHRSFRFKMLSCVPAISIIAVVLAMAAIIAAFNMNLSIIRKVPPELKLPYDNPIPSCRSVSDLANRLKLTGNSSTP